MSIANSLWGAPRIHGELLKLGFEIGQTSVAKYMVRRIGPPSQRWKTFLNNHADGIAAMDLFVVPTISFCLLYGLLIMGHGRRQILWFGVISHPTAEWMNGLQISSRKHAAGNRLPAISFVTGTGPMVRSLSVDLDRWAFATDAAFGKESEGGIEYEKCRNNRTFEIFAEHQLKDDRDLKQDRNRRQEFAQHQPQRVNGNIGGRIRANLGANAAGAGKSFYWVFHRFC